MTRLMVERIIEFENSDSLDFEQIEQRIATLDIDSPDEWTPNRLVEAAYTEANMKPRCNDHRITRLGESMEVSDD